MRICINKVKIENTIYLVFFVFFLFLMIFHAYIKTHPSFSKIPQKNIINSEKQNFYFIRKNAKIDYKIIEENVKKGNISLKEAWFYRKLDE